MIRKVFSRVESHFQCFSEPLDFETFRQQSKHIRILEKLFLSNKRKNNDSVKGVLKSKGFSTSVHLAFMIPIIIYKKFFRNAFVTKNGLLWNKTENANMRPYVNFFVMHVWSIEKAWK